MGRVRISGGLIGVVAASLLAAPAPAQITIDPAVVVFEPSEDSKSIIVTNDGKELGLATAKPRVVTAPGAADEKLRVEPNPADLHLLVTPLRLALDPGERRAVTLMTLDKPGAADRVWRVQIAPAVGKLKPNQSGVSFIVGYDALVIQRAANPKPAVSGTRDGTKLILLNGGNSFAFVQSVEQCGAAADCATLPGKRLYAGQFAAFELPRTGGTVTVSIEGVGRRVDKLKF